MKKFNDFFHFIIWLVSSRRELKRIFFQEKYLFVGYGYCVVQSEPYSYLNKKKVLIITLIIIIAPRNIMIKLEAPAPFL